MTEPKPVQGPCAGWIDPEREVRIAVVLYGGVSLAIYIHGVTHELLRLVRATAPAAPLGAGARTPLIADHELQPLDCVYRELGVRIGSGDPLREALDPQWHNRVRTRFVVDVLSGTSAGGINGVFLAKALANLQELGTLRDLWLSEGDLGRLLNDRITIPDALRGTAPAHPPTSLLNSRRMYYLLLDALNGLEREQERERAQTGRPAPRATPLVDELNLYVTATDLAGLALPIPLWNGAVFERRHRNVFRFVYASEAASGSAVNDFAPRMNPFLAFAARCTSSFPVAFEPMRLDDIVGLKGAPSDRKALDAAMTAWEGFIRDYLEAPGHGEEPARDFSLRSFGDGGYLDNKPFSYATDALRRRRSDRYVERKLFYVEPSPEDPELDRDAGARPKRPDAFENLAAATTGLPRAETIREDIERVLERNRILDRIARAIEHVDLDLATPGPSGHGAPPPGREAPGPPGRRAPPDEEEAPSFGDTGLRAMVDQYGPPYGAYHRLRVSQTTDQMAVLFARTAGFDENSALTVALRFLVAAWRERRYVREPPGAEEAPAARFPGRAPLTENRFLLAFDFDFRSRRLRFLQERLNALLEFAESESRRLADAARDREHEAAEPGVYDPKTIEARVKWRTEREDQRKHDTEQDLLAARAILDRGGLAAGTTERMLDEWHREGLVRSTLALKSAIADVQVALRRAGRDLRARSGANPLRDQVRRLGLSVGELQWLLSNPLDEERKRRAWDLLAGPPHRLAIADEIMEGLERQITEIRKDVNARLDDVLQTTPAAPDADPDTGALPQSTTDWCLRRALRNLFRSFVSYDVVLLPLLYGVEDGEAARVDIVRISPEDATTLIAERDPEDRWLRVRKLAGTRLGNFGAFFEERWRASDLLWGRLDGADRIIRAMLVPRDRDEERVLEGLVLRAQAAIVCEETRKLDDAEARRLMLQCLMRTTSSKVEMGLLEGMMGRLLPAIEAIDADTARKLRLDAMRVDYKRHFEWDRDLKPAIGVPLFARATQIFGRLLDGLSARYGPLDAKKAGAWVLFAGRAVWGLVEISLPRGVWTLLASYWLNLLYLLSVVGMAAGILLGLGPLRMLGVRLLAFAAIVNLARWLMQAYLLRRLRLLKLLKSVAIVLAVAGIVSLLLQWGAFERWADRQFTTVMDRLPPWLGWLRRVGAWICPKC